jgi:hypothetical protein
MGFFGRLVGGKRKQNGLGAEAGGDANTPIEMKRVEVSSTPKMTKQEMVEELERNYREVLDLVRRVKDHLDREEPRATRVMEVAERVESVLPAVESLAERIGEGQDHAATRIVEAIETSDHARTESVQRLEQILSDLHANIEAGGMTHQRIATELDGLGEHVSELAEASVMSSRALRAIRDGASDRDTKFVSSIEIARKSIVRAIWIGAAVVGGALIIAAIVFKSSGGLPGG